MTTQSEKQHLSLAGEYFVAAELQRRGVSAVVTFGNAKKADVVAFNDSGQKVVVVEVKSTAQGYWTFSGRVTEPSDKIWVFVHVPKVDTQSPSYYILTQSELYGILGPSDAEFQRKFKEKNGKDFDNRSWVSNLSLEQAEPHRGKWQKIIAQLA